MDDLYAKLFVDTDRSHADLIELVADLQRGEVDGWTVESLAVEVDVRPNDEFEPGADDFLLFPFTLDVETVGGTLGDFLEALAALARGLAERGCRVVTACDWEDRLPGGGRVGF